MANPVSVDHGTAYYRGLIAEADSGLAGLATTVGTFTVTAAATTTITDAAVRANAQVVCFPINAEAGLLLRGATCYVGTISAGSFTFVISATSTAAGPQGDEEMGYLAVSRS